jgi:hypothetical protein
VADEGGERGDEGRGLEDRGVGGCGSLCCYGALLCTLLAMSSYSYIRSTVHLAYTLAARMHNSL